MSLNACRHKTCSTSQRGTAGPKTPRVGQGAGGSAGHGSAHGWCHDTVGGLGGKDPKHRLAPTPCHGWDAPHKVRRPVMASAPLLLWCRCLFSLVFAPEPLGFAPIPLTKLCFCPKTPFLTHSLPLSRWGTRLPAVVLPFTDLRFILTSALT